MFFLVPTGRGTGLEALTPEEREGAMHWLHDVSTRVAIKTTEGPQYRRIVIEAQRGVPYAGGELYRFHTAETLKGLGPADAARPRMANSAGSGFVFIDHLGDVYPNGFLPLHCGNVKDTTLPEIYSRSTALAMTGDPLAFGRPRRRRRTRPRERAQAA